MKILNFAPEADKHGHYGFHNIRYTFLRFGFEVIDFDFVEEEKAFGRREMNRRLKQIIDRERPEIFYHAIVNDELDRELLDYITQQSDTTSLVLLSDDDWRLNHSLDWVGHYNFAITTVKEALPEYERRGHNHVLFCQWGCNPHLYRPLPAEKKYDVTFVGQAYGGRPELIKFLKARRVNVRVWGSGWENFKELREVAGGYLPTFKVVNLFSQSKIVLGMAWTSQGMRPQIKGRIFEYAASGAFQLTNYDERLREYFQEGKEIIFYHSPEDLLEKINYYLEHEREREQIARQAGDRARRDHTWEQRWQSLFHSMAERRPAGKKGIEIPRYEKSSPAVSGTISHSESTGTPLVSVITYVHNMAEFLDELIPSVLNQTYGNFEYLLLDDGSTDNTKEVISKYLSDNRLRYVYQENMGQKGRFIHRVINKCLSLTHGELVCLIGGDDVFMPNRLERHVEEFIKDPELDIAFSEAEKIDAQGRVYENSSFGIAAHPFNRWNLARTLFKFNVVPHPTVMMRRSCFDKVGGFEDGFAADYQFWLKSAAHLKFKFVNEKLIKYRIHEKGTSTGSTNREFAVYEAIRLMQSARQRYSILDLYPEIQYCKDKERALISAYIDFGVGLAQGNIPAPQLAITEFKKALEHNPNQIEAINNIGVCLMIIGQPAEGIAWLERGLGSGTPVVERNLQRTRQMATNAGQSQTFELLMQNPDTTELFRIDPETSEKQLFLDKVEIKKLIESARALKQQGSFNRAIEVLERAKSSIEVSPDARPQVRPAGRQHECMVSIIVPTHNRPDMLMEALKSILNQTYRDFEIIVVNDAGSDVSDVINFLNKGNEITYVQHNRNRGRSATRNSGLKLARGKYVAYLDDDDVFYPNHLETLVTFLETNPCKAAYTDAYLAKQEWQNTAYHVTKRELIYSFDFNPEHILVRNYIPTLCVMHERACLDKVGWFDEGLEVHEDWDMWIRIGLAYGMTHIKKTTAEFRSRPDGSNSTTSHAKKRAFLDTADIIHHRYRAYAEHNPNILSCQQDFREKLRQEAEQAEGKIAARPAAKAAPNQTTTSKEKTETPAAATEAKELKVLVYTLEPLLYACPTIRLLSPLTSEVLQGKVKVMAGTSFSGSKHSANVGVDLKGIESADIIVIQRQMASAAQAMGPISEKARALGKKIIYEIDDNFLSMPEQHSLRGYFAPMRDDVIKVASMADAVTVPTPELAKVFARYNRNTHVLPNLIDERLWSAEPNSSAKGVRVKDKMVIGYMGTPEHETDFAAVITAILDILQKYRGKVVFRFWGCVPEKLLGVEGVESIGAMEDHYYQFAQAFRSVDFDIALAPLADNEFNRCKSNMKFLEYAVCRIPGIYSKVTPYATTIADGITGLLVNNDPEAWAAAMTRLIENESLRETIANNAYQEVLSRYTVEKNAQRWLRLYHDVLAGKAEIQHRKKVSIIIPVFNKVEYTQQCLRALEANTGYANREVIVVDNGSTDDTKPFLASLGNKIKVINNETNLGFAKACNQGARAATGDHLVFLNNDTIPLPGWLEAMVKVAEEDAQVGVVGSKLLYPDDTIQHAGVVVNVNTRTPYHIYRRFDRDHPAVNRVREYPVVTGACLLIRRDLFFEVAGFDERYINCYEDVDLCLKVGEKGYRIIYTPHSVLYHYESVSEGRHATDHVVQSTMVLREKWGHKMPCDEDRYYAEDGLKLEYEGPTTVRAVPVRKIESLLTLARIYKGQCQYQAAIENLERAKGLFAELGKCA